MQSMIGIAVQSEHLICVIAIKLFQPLFLAYWSVDDEDFCDYFRDVENQYDEGRIDIDPKALMIKGATEYMLQMKLVKRSKLLEDKTKILALKAEIKSSSAPLSAQPSRKMPSKAGARMIDAPSR